MRASYHEKPRKCNQYKCVPLCRRESRPLTFLSEVGLSLSLVSTACYKSNINESQEKDNSKSLNKIDSHNAMKPKSRLVGRLLKTLNSPDTLETALAFSSG